MVWFRARSIGFQARDFLPRLKIAEMTLLDCLDQSPPFLCYYLIRDGGSHPGTEVIAERAGLSATTVRRLARSITWAPWRLSVINKFCDALGFSFVVNIPAKGATNGARFYFIKPFKRYLEFLASGKQKNPMRHLDAREKQRFLALCQKWREARELPF